MTVSRMRGVSFLHRGLLINSYQRELHCESRAKAFARAFGLNGAAVHLNQMTYDCQAEAQPSMPSGGSRVGLPETVKDIRKKVMADALARIMYDDLEMRSDSLKPDLDAAAL